jgi:hypothetical protein
MKNKIFRLILAVWVIIWVFFTMREIFIKANLRDYKVLLQRSLEGKKAYVTGDKFYQFLTFCNNKLPDGAGYMWVRMDKEDLDRRRASYYLYPHLEREDAEFVLIYGEPNVVKNDYEIFNKLDETRYILKKKGSGKWK